MIRRDAAIAQWPPRRQPATYAIRRLDLKLQTNPFETGAFSLRGHLSWQMPDFASKALAWPSMRARSPRFAAVYSQAPTPGRAAGPELTKSPVQRAAEELGLEVSTPVSLNGRSGKQDALFGRLSPDVPRWWWPHPADPARKRIPSKAPVSAPCNLHGARSCARGVGARRFQAGDHGGRCGDSRVKGDEDGCRS